MEIILWIVFVYFAQVFLCTFINMILGVRSPNSCKEFLCMTFLPCLLFNWKKYK